MVKLPLGTRCLRGITRSQRASGLLGIGVLALMLAVGSSLRASGAVFTANTGAEQVSLAGATDDLEWESGSPLNDNLVWWLDATETNTLYSDSGCTTPATVGGTVQCWADRRPGYSAVVGTGTTVTRSASPINGLSSVNLPTTTDFLAGPDLLGGSTSDITIYIITRENVRRQSFFFSLNGNDITNEARFTFGPWSAGQWFFDPGNIFVDRIVTPNNFLPVGATVQLTGWKDSAAGRNYLYINGTTFQSGGLGPAPTSGGLRLGYTGSQMPASDVAEVLVFNKALNASERGQVSAYLRAKWGLA